MKPLRALVAALLCLVAASAQSYLAPVTAELRKAWPSNRAVNIVCHGHSVPAGYFKTPEVRSLEAYPHLVREGLARLFPQAVINVIVTAIGGENSLDGAARFEKDVLALHPDVILIDYSLNDRRVGLDAAKSAWTAMIRAAKDRGAKVILLTPTPDLKARLGDPQDPLEQQAAQVRQLAAEFGVGLADSLAAFERARDSEHMPKLMAQFNHPNAKGHRLVASEILKQFRGPSRTGNATERNASLSITAAVGMPQSKPSRYASAVLEVNDGVPRAATASACRKKL